MQQKNARLNSGAKVIVSYVKDVTDVLICFYF